MNQLHIEQRNLAAQQIKENGTAFTITLSNVPNPDKPWETLPGTTEVGPFIGVFTQNKNKSINGSIVDKKQVTILCVPTTPPLTEEQIIGCVITRTRDSASFTVYELEIVAPGDVEILYKIKVNV